MLGWAVLGRHQGVHTQTRRQTVRGTVRDRVSRPAGANSLGEGAPASPWDVSTASPVAPPFPAGFPAW